MKAIFKKDFNYSSRIRNAGWSVKASPEPQSFPRELVEAAIEAGVAEELDATESAP
jgi:hypothetical protein